MHYLKKELNKVFPLALLWGAIGGVLLIVIANVFMPNMLSVLSVYALITSISVYALNHMRYKNEVMSSVIYSYSVFSVMTIIAYLDAKMNTNPDFVHPLFENLGFLMIVGLTVGLIASSVAYLFKKRIIS